MAKSAIKAPQKPWEREPHWQWKYGLWWEPIRDTAGKPFAPRPAYMIESECYMACMGWHSKGIKPTEESPGEWISVPGLRLVDENGEERVLDQRIHTGAEYHFMKMVDFFFSDPHGIFYFQWNPFAIQMLKDKVRYRRYAVAGPASSGKTEFGVVWVLMNYLCDPFNTKVLVSSTTKSSAAGKVWGSIEEAWQQVQKVLGGPSNMPGKLLSSQYKIVYSVNGVRSTKSGIELVAGAESAENESSDTVQGYKRGRIFALIDEFATTSKGLWETIKGNLFANPVMDFYGAFNPDSFYDVAGQFCKPRDPRGWEAVDVDSELWEGMEGWVRHLDGEKSPNVLAGHEKWRGILTWEKLQSKVSEFGGRMTKKFWQFVRGWWSPAGTLESIFTESEIIKYQADHEVLDWDMPPEMVAGFDPSYTHGGDLAILMIGKCGLVTEPITRRKKKVLQLTECHILAENVKDTDPRLEQMVTQCIQICKSKGVKPRHLAVDATGAGVNLCPRIAEQWSNEFMRVVFNGKATDLPLSASEPQKASEKMANLVSEMWMAGKALIRTGQFKFFGKFVPDLVSEMCARIIPEKKANSVKIHIEPKDEMKKRTGGKSPDRADAAFLCLHVCRQRLGLVSTEKPAKTTPQKNRTDSLHSYLTGENKRNEPLFDWGPPLKY